MDQGLFTAPHGLSQCTTSFIASCCQGIHQTPLSRLIRSGKSKAGVLSPSSGGAFCVPRASFRSEACTFPAPGLEAPKHPASRGMPAVSVPDLE
jgi:hypothetical protein